MSADTYKINAVFTFTALLTIVAFSANTVKAHPAAAAKLIVGTIHAFIVAFRTHFGTFGASAGAASANSSHAIDTLIAAVTVVALAADTVEAFSAFAAYTSICAVFTFFAALFTDQRTFRTSVAAGTYRIYTVFAHLTVWTEVSFTSNAVNTGHTA